MTSRRRGAALWTAGTVLWLFVVGGGVGVLWRYRSAAGQEAAAPARWPEGSSLRRAAPTRATLVLLAHPRCPCTRASLAELAKIARRFGDRVTAHVLLLRPAGTGEGWVETDLWRSAHAIPGVTVTTDEDGAEARRFGAHTSGQVLLYDGAGRLAYSGGITGGRGHVGDNLGEARVAALLDGGDADRPSGPVFGCPLDDPKSAP